MPADTASDTKPKRRAPLWRGVRILRALSLVYLALVALAIVGQEFMIFPGESIPTPARVPSLPRSEPFTIVSSDGTKLAGLFCRATLQPPGRKPPTILYFYGNGSQVAYSRAEIDLFRAAGAQVLLIDYPGYGASEGKASELSLYRAADALWDYAISRPEVDERQITVVGWSLGGAVAIDLASRRPAAGLVTVSTFTTMDEMARRTVPFIPTSLILRHRFDSISKITSLHMPIVIAHGMRDSIIPFAMSQELRDAIPNVPVRHVPISDADHNDVFITGARPLRDALEDLLALVRQRDTAPDSPAAPND